MQFFRNCLNKDKIENLKISPIRVAPLGHRCRPTENAQHSCHRFTHRHDHHPFAIQTVSVAQNSFTELWVFLSAYRALPVQYAGCMIQTDLVGFQVTDEEVVPDSVIGQRGSFRHLSGDVSQMTVQLCVLRCWNQRFTFAGIQVKYKDFNESINIIYNVSFLRILYFVNFFFF